VRIAILQGHPDPRGQRFCRALADAYVAGALDAGHEARTIDVAVLQFPLLRTAEDWQSEPAPPAIRGAQDVMSWAQHVVIFFPLWMGDMPALLKGFLEQALRPGFALAKASKRGLPKGLMKGRSARIVVTMGMPGFFYRLYYRAHSVKSLRRNILGLAGFSPVRTSLLGMVETKGVRERALAKMAMLGRKGS
jgi:putative NADPH-quinone reductase